MLLNTKLYVDLDGVLADFDSHYSNLFSENSDKSFDNVDWSLVHNHGNFFRTLPILEDLKLWKYIEKYNPIILSGVPKEVPNASDQKHDWIDEKIGYNVERITCLSKEKSLYCNPGDIIIDDWDKYRHLWEEKGGIWVLHTTADDTIEQLKELGL